jgi:crossover junction endodeoxyribonuclease RuvC
MIVLGVDPGISNLGLAVVEGDAKKASLHYAGAVTTRAHEPAPLRAGRLFEAVEALIQAHAPEAVAIEAQYFYRQNERAFQVGWGFGAVLIAAHRAGLAVFAYGPMQVKKALVGHGRADKAQVAFMVRALLGLKQTPASSHAADALAVALTHLAHLRTGTTPRV